MSQLAILDGHMNALLDGLRMLVQIAGVVLGFFTLLIALIAKKEGDWRPLLALVIGLGFPVVGTLLAPFFPHGTFLGASLMVLGVSMA
jgi:hypothetical protein